MNLKQYRIWLVYGIGLLVIVLMVWDILFSDHGYFVFKEEYKQQQQLDAEIRSLQIEAEKLKAEIIQLRENPKTLEQVIHEELGYVYPDEYMLIMPVDTYEQIEAQKIGNTDD